MAIEIIIGNVGSGKTYYATYRIWQEVKKIYEAEIKGYDYKYKRILTNIEGIKENKYVKVLKVEQLIKLYEQELQTYKRFEQENAEINIQDEFKKIDFNNIQDEEKDTSKKKLLEIIKHFPNHNDLLREYKSENDKILEFIKIADDKEKAYIEHTKPIFEKAGFTECLIIIDEAHNYFSRLSGAKERLVSYHRHYDQDYIFITQDLKQLSRKVTAIAQKTIRAVNPIMKATKTFRYKVYSGGYISYNDTNLLEKITLKADPDIFRLYNSGSSKQQKSYLFKVLAKPIAMLILLIVGFAYLINSYTHRQTSNTLHTNKTEKIAQEPSKSKQMSRKSKKNDLSEFVTVKVLKAKNFYIYNNKKYYFLDFLEAMRKCNAFTNAIIKNLDSSETVYIKIKDKECLEHYLQSVVY